MKRTSGSFNIHALLLALAAVVLISGITRAVLTGQVAGSKKVHITFWNGFTGPDGIVMLDIINRFNEANPDVQVTMQRIPWATYYNKLTVAGSDNRGPAVFVVHADALPRIRRAGFIDDASQVFQGPNGISPKDFNAFVLDRVRFKHKFYGVPLDIHTQGMYCDADMLRAAGIVDENGQPRPPRTKEEFIKTLDATTLEPGRRQPDKQWGFALTNWVANFQSIMPQFGGNYLDAKGNANLNSPENIKALEFIQMLVKTHRTPPPSNGLGWLGFRQKQVAMVWDGVFMLGDLKRVNTFNYLGAPIPMIGDRPGTMANSHCLCIRTKLSAREHDAVVRFIRYLSSHALEWAEAGQVPARISLRNTPQFKNMQVQYANSLQVSYIQYPPKTPIIFDVMFILGQAVEHVVRETQTPKQALDEANKAAQDAIDRDRKENPQDQIQ